VARKHHTLRRLLNYCLVQAEMKLGRNRLWSHPYQLTIDVTNKCNLHCPYCPTGRGEQGGRGRGTISYELFTAILDELGPYAYDLELFNWGEPFFNRELPKLLAYASGKRVRTVVSTNLSFPMTEDYIGSVVTAGLSGLTAAIDGVDQASYERYRRGGDFDLAIRNLQTFVRVKRELASATPDICWQYLVFAHNEAFVERARALAAEIGTDFFTAVAGLHDDPAWTPKETYNLDYLRVHPNRCTFLWEKAVFHWDGGFASCCMGFHKHDDFDTFRPGDFRRLWNNEKFVAARRIWTERDSALPDGHFCVGCDKVHLYRGLPLRSHVPPTTRVEPAQAASSRA
jgi:pyruvate-formate lyase-activating enzyme